MAKKEKKNTWTNNNIQSTTQKTNDRATQAPFKSGVVIGCGPEGLAVPHTTFFYKNQSQLIWKC